MDEVQHKCYTLCIPIFHLMSTSKMRIHMTVPVGIDRALEKLAERDNSSLSSKAIELIVRALELEEDFALLHVAQTREKGMKKSRYLSHEDIWG